MQTGKTLEQVTSNRRHSLLKAESTCGVPNNICCSRSGEFDGCENKAMPASTLPVPLPSSLPRRRLLLAAGLSGMARSGSLLALASLAFS